MLRFATSAALLLGSVAFASAATPQCLRSADAEADQAIRYQTEVMVVSDTCGGQTYTRFAHRNRAALVEYQKQVIERFRRSGAPHAEARFDSYQTQLANEVSLRVSARPVAEMCREHQSFLATADQLSGDGFRRYVATQLAVHHNPQLCHD